MKHVFNSRKVFSVVAILVVLAAMVFAFWPQPTLVDLGTVSRAPMQLSIQEEGRTQVHDRYVISAPFTGRLLRVDLEPGDNVTQNTTEVARLLPANPTALNVRELRQAQAMVAVADSALAEAKAGQQKAQADIRLAQAAYQRASAQHQAGVISAAMLDQATHDRDAAEAALSAANAMIAVRQAELTNAQAALTGLEQVESGGADPVTLLAPITGRVLTIAQESETTLTAGTPILEIGDIQSDTEIVVELLSTQAVQVDVGDRVMIENWGGSQALAGWVARIDPYGFTKYSALGVEEQRVNTIVQFAADNPDYSRLGDGYRVDVRIIIWESEDALVIPASALFREHKGWYVFVQEGDQAIRRAVEIDRNNGIQASVQSGLEVGERVVLYPSAQLSDGAYIASRESL